MRELWAVGYTRWWVNNHQQWPAPVLVIHTALISNENIFTSCLKMSFSSEKKISPPVKFPTSDRFRLECAGATPDEVLLKSYFYRVLPVNVIDSCG